METTQINAYNKPSKTPKTAAANPLNSAGKANGTSLDMQDFLNLLSAQLTNQDVMNPSTDTQFIAQMAQFTSLQAMQTLTEISYAQYGAAMVGKNVIVATYDKKGNMEKDTGVVSNVKFMNGAVSITVNGKDYDMSSVMEVLDQLEKPQEPQKA
ncbi:flagellar hook capping FlgD N-terminal domain-containing protein [Paludicola sp. MB14-C6]|uniref:flagellar hook capping FlgD N-terminal domain-containing protein n=1 Tax=Paludihabitans sp. MB14-C6 TaxID=3070656 RepID=UPI0027DBBFF8|nr:flagellar hook capping FlgD N-terminal domain-containing protein [Paludicola sp. MB14-C6]WMJ24245.1 flagellar hook capping FlgD N-terminal domain-containing protein [Paludicola sp. MB14-C6]